jgi:pimeloyl-ACP methyl ester carboxylesterase
MHDPHRVAGTARRVLRQGRVVVYEGASHAVNGECPDRIAADVAALREALP